MNLIAQRGMPKEYKDLDSGRTFFSISQVRTMMDDSFRYVPKATREEASRRGTTLHLRFALALAAKVGLGPYPDVIPQYAGWCRCMDLWIRDTWFELIKVEQPSVWEAQGIAGTPENKLRLRSGLAIVDLKTGGKTSTDGVQLMLNQKLEGYEDVTELIDLYVSEDGKPNPVPQSYDPFAFATSLNALQVLKWRLTL